MTITEQLQFSVLTAPVASVDRRALSQAWYSALYGTAKPPSQAKRTALPCTQAPPSRPQPREDAEKQEAAHHAIARVQTPERADRTAGTSPERRAPRSRLARKIERMLLRPRAAAHKTSFSIDAEQGRVHVILHARGAQLRLVAICPPKARAHVAAALAQARYALAARGLDLSAETRGGATC